MRVAHPDLQRVTWDQAAILGFASANGFRELHIEPVRIRWWVKCGYLAPVAVGPHAHLMYLIPEVVECADQEERRAQSAQILGLSGSS